MDVVRKILFDGRSLQVGLVTVRPSSDACGDVERQTSNVVVLPLQGVFSKHDTPTQQVVGTPGHAVFLGVDKPYRVGFPGAIGDRCLTLRFGEETASDETGGPRDKPAPQALLPADAMILRNILLQRLTGDDCDQFEIEDLSLHLLGLSLKALRPRENRLRSSTFERRKLAVQRVKEAVASAPADKWTVAQLAAIARLSPYHLCHVFRETVGASIFDYVLHERLASALDAVLDRGDDLTMVALDAGFSSHSHFTARFRGFFGYTPAMLRRMATSRDVKEFRKIMTARRSMLAIG